MGRDYSGRFIVFEGIDGSGKSTLADRSYSRLKDEFPKRVQINHPTRFPQRRRIGAVIRSYLERGANTGCPDIKKFRIGVLQEWFAADRRDAANELLEDGDSYAMWQRLNSGEVLIGDRHISAREGYTLAGVLEEIGSWDEELLAARLSEIEIDEREPDKDGILWTPQEDVCIYLRMPANVAMESIDTRLDGQEGAERELFEEDSFQAKVARVFDWIAVRRPDVWHVIEGMNGKRRRTEEELENQVFDEVIYPMLKGN